MRWFVLALNPDPWAIGPLGVGKRGGKYFPYVGRNNQLHSYQQAVKEELEDEPPLRAGTYDLKFWFWRRLDSHAAGRKNIADATNLQKATEDALQGVLFDNDRDVRHVSSVIVEQSEEAKPLIVIRAMPWPGFENGELPDFVWGDIINAQRTASQPPSNNVWSGPDGR
jgi:hypothetical protein